MKRFGFIVLVGLLLIMILGPVSMANAQEVGPLDHVVISPESALVATSETQQFTAVGQDASNNAIPDETFTWEIVAGGGSINESGLFTAGTAAGTYTNAVVATAVSDTSKKAYATVRVAVRGQLDHVVISPTSAAIPVKGTQQFTAVGEDAFNDAVSETFTWAVVAGGGSIDNSGLFTAGTTTGTYTDTVVATAVSDTSKIACATVIVTNRNDKSLVPPGWSHGKKTGWHGSDTPPGWAKGEKVGWDGEDAPRGKK